eukprot:CAMPEP_0182852396 /NCGR_PEP_ID=MMETSP0034_2-20130328/142_1 /TAXON_ID=156128 /ORGANISM="Nephroselmis pyriformis, Strain CCMP717" /LENGTH=38 /DNA_ID= /DNA_START= /DNA_END= /DNA_ORIENTATION=
MNVTNENARKASPTAMTARSRSVGPRLRSLAFFAAAAI